MRIGVDASSLIAKKTGIGSFASSLIDEMMAQAPDIDWRLYRPENGRDFNTPSRMAWETFSLSQKASHDQVNAFYSPGFSPPVFGKFKKIVTVHDLIGLIYPSNVRSVSSFYWSKWLPNNLKKAGKLIASSASTRRDIERFLKIPSKNIEVVPLAARPRFKKTEDRAAIENTLKKYGLKTPFLISVSTLEPRKNFITLLRAYEKIRGSDAEFSLVIAGKPAGAEAELESFIVEKKLGDRVKLLGYVPDEDLICLYNAAAGYAMISLYEGFGLPVLEAMSCGLTGIISNNSSLPEVAGDTAIQVDPKNTEAVTEALDTLIKDASRRSALAAAALIRSKEFSMQRTAGRMVKILKKEREN